MTEVFWHSRGYLPHWEPGETPQSITFRLGDSLPVSLLQRWEDDLKYLPDAEASRERRQRIEDALDRGEGEMHLADPGIAGLVEQALLCFDQERYRMHAWSIMPNHVHVLMTPLEEFTLSKILHNWKSFTAKQANALLRREGVFWAPEYHDRYIRDEAHFANTMSYIALNPVKAGLCSRPGEWRYSSFWEERK